MIVSEFFARLGVDMDGGSFARVEQRLSGLGKTLGGVAAVFVGAFAGSQVSQWLKSVAGEAAALNDQALRLGVSTKALQEYQLAAELTGSSAGALQTALQVLSRQATNAEGGSKALAKAFRSIGVELSGAEDSTQLLDRVADAVAATEDPIQRVAVAQKLLGRAGADLIPLLSQGAAGMAELRAEAEALGGGFGDETIRAADEFDDNIVRMRFSVRSLSAALGNVLLPIADKLVRAMTRWIVAGSKLIKNIRDWMRTNMLLQATLVTLASVGLGLAIRSAVLWAASIVKLLPVIRAWIMANRALLVSYAQLAAVWIVALVVIAAIVLAIEDVWVALRGGKSLFAELINKIGGLGAADRWAEGFAILLANVLTPVRALISSLVLIPKLLAKLAGADIDVSGDVKNVLGFFDDSVAAAKALAATIAGRDKLADKTIGQGINAPLDERVENLPRAAAQGIAAPLIAGSAGFDKISAATAASVNQTTGGALGAPFSPVTNVTVNAQTNANPREIAREAERAARRVNSEQAGHVQRALAGRKNARGAQ